MGGTQLRVEDAPAAPGLGPVWAEEAARALAIGEGEILARSADGTWSTACRDVVERLGAWGPYALHGHPQGPVVAVGERAAVIVRARPGSGVADCTVIRPDGRPRLQSVFVAGRRWFALAPDRILTYEDDRLVGTWMLPRPASDAGPWPPPPELRSIAGVDAERVYAASESGLLARRGDDWTRIEPGRDHHLRAIGPPDAREVVSSYRCVMRGDACERSGDVPWDAALTRGYVLPWRGRSGPFWGARDALVAVPGPGESARALPNDRSIDAAVVPELDLLRGGENALLRPSDGSTVRIDGEAAGDIYESVALAATSAGTVWVATIGGDDEWGDRDPAERALVEIDRSGHVVRRDDIPITHVAARGANALAVGDGIWRLTPAGPPRRIARTRGLLRVCAGARGGWVIARESAVRIDGDRSELVAFPPYEVQAHALGCTDDDAWIVGGTGILHCDPAGCEALPRRVPGASAVVVADGETWIFGHRFALRARDPWSARLDLGSVSPTDAWADARGIWLTRFGGHPPSRDQELLRFLPPTAATPHARRIDEVIQLVPPRPHGARIRSAATGYSGRIAVTVADDGTVAIHDPRSGALLAARTGLFDVSDARTVRADISSSSVRVCDGDRGWLWHVPDGSFVETNECTAVCDLIDGCGWRIRYRERGIERCYDRYPHGVHRCETLLDAPRGAAVASGRTRKVAGLDTDGVVHVLDRIDGSSAATRIPGIAPTYQTARIAVVQDRWVAVVLDGSLVYLVDADDGTLRTIETELPAATAADLVVPWDTTRITVEVGTAHATFDAATGARVHDPPATDAWWPRAAIGDGRAYFRSAHIDHDVAPDDGPSLEIERVAIDHGELVLTTSSGDVRVGGTMLVSSRAPTEGSATETERACRFAVRCTGPDLEVIEDGVATIEEGACLAASAGSSVVPAISCDGGFVLEAWRPGHAVATRRSDGASLVIELVRARGSVHAVARALDGAIAGAPEIIAQLGVRTCMVPLLTPPLRGAELRRRHVRGGLIGAFLAGRPLPRATPSPPCTADDG